MKRSELDGLDREALIRLAEENGVARARILTRPELIDEILVRTAPADSEADVSIARGFFGLARDLVARVVERGLHLPDAATRIRSIAIDSPRRSSPPAALPTVTLAQIYAAQGHTQRAVDTLRRVLEAEPEHVDARELLEKLTDAAYVAPKPPLPPEPDDGRVSFPPPPSTPAPGVAVAVVAKEVVPRAPAEDAPIPESPSIEAAPASAARPIEAAVASALMFASGSLVPLSIVALVPEGSEGTAVAIGSLLLLAILGAVAAKVGGAGLVRPTIRVAFWGALAMATTAGVGALFGVAL
jgi:hypothetical protein